MRRTAAAPKAAAHLPRVPADARAGARPGRLPPRSSSRIGAGGGGVVVRGLTGADHEGSPARTTAGRLVDGHRRDARLRAGVLCGCDRAGGVEARAVALPPQPAAPRQGSGLRPARGADGAAVSNARRPGGCRCDGGVPHSPRVPPRRGVVKAHPSSRDLGPLASAMMMSRPTIVEERKKIRLAASAGLPSGPWKPRTPAMIAITTKTSTQRSVRMPASREVALPVDAANGRLLTADCRLPTAYFFFTGFGSRFAARSSSLTVEATPSFGTSSLLIHTSALSTTLRKLSSPQLR